MNNHVSLTPYLLRFAAGYVVLSIVANIVVATFGLKSGVGLSAAILAIAALYPANKFAADQLRIFTRKEFWHMLLGSVAIDLLLETLLAFVVVPKAAVSGMFVGVLAFVGLLHALLIGFMFSDNMMKRFVQDKIRKKETGRV